MIFMYLGHDNATAQFDDYRNLRYLAIRGSLQALARFALLACYAMSIGCATSGRITSINGATTPELQALLPRIHELGETVYPKLLDLTFEKGRSSPSRFSIEIVRDFELGDAPARGHIVGAVHRGANKIQLDADSLRSNPVDLDSVLVHEMAHVAQHYGRHAPNYWVEGMAEYAEIKLGYTNYASPCECSLKHPHYKSGWGCAGAFLFYMDSVYGESVVLALDHALRKGTYSDALFKTSTGKDLESLWQEFEKSKFMPPTAVAENDLLRQLHDWPERVREGDIIRYVTLMQGTNATAILKDIGVTTEMKKSDFAARYVAYTYLHSSGGKQWLEAAAFLAKLGPSGCLPGWSPDMSYPGFPWGTREHYPFSATFCGRRSGLNYYYMYEVVHSSPEDGWVLKRVWKSGPDGNILEELPLKQGPASSGQ